MRGDLDDLLSGLARAPADRSLQAVESAVMAGVARERDARRTLHVLLPAQAAMIAVCIGIGLVAGGAAVRVASPPHELAMISTDLAPSTLLASNP
jgi:hypothetical protein